MTFQWWHHLWQIMQPKTRFSFENFQGCMNSARRCQNQRKSRNLLFSSFQFLPLSRCTESTFLSLVGRFFDIMNSFLRPVRNFFFDLFIVLKILWEIILGRCIGTRVNPSTQAGGGFLTWNIVNVIFCQYCPNIVTNYSRTVHNVTRLTLQHKQEVGAFQRPQVTEDPPIDSE